MSDASLHISSRGAFSYVWNNCTDSNSSYADKFISSIKAFVEAFFCEYTVVKAEISRAFLTNGIHENSIFGKEYKKIQEMNVVLSNEPDNEKTETKEESNNFYKKEPLEDKKNDLAEKSNRVSAVDNIEELVDGKDFNISDNRSSEANLKSVDSIWRYLQDKKKEHDAYKKSNNHKEQDLLETKKNNLTEKSSAANVSVDELEKLICDGFNIDDKRFSEESLGFLEEKDCHRLLNKARELNNKELAIRLLLIGKCDLSADEQKTFLFFFVHNNSTLCVAYLLKKDTTHLVNCEDALGNTPLILAAEKGYLGCLNALLHYGAKANSFNHKKVTALCAAAAHGHIECLKSLLCKGADCDINEQDTDGNTPLHFAINLRNEECFGELLAVNLKNPIDINKANVEGNTPFHLAAQCESRVYVDALFAKDNMFDANQLNADGDTPLHCAIKRGAIECVGALLERRDLVDVHVLNRNGRTPLQYAISHNVQEAIKLLQN